MELVIAEKPSVAQSIAAVLGATQRKDGYLEGNEYLVYIAYQRTAGNQLKKFLPVQRYFSP